MDQELAKQELNVKSRPEVKKNTQQFKIQRIWEGLKKTEWNNEKNEDKKSILKGELYTKVQEIYLQQNGKDVKRSTIRRCVNSLIKQAN